MSDTAADDSAVSPVAGPTPRPGRMLAEARVAKGLSLAEVAAQLKLSPSQVTALEADDYGSLPGPVFVRGFIRNYARLLDQNPEQISGSLSLPLASAPAAAAIPVSRDIPFPTQKSRTWLPYAAVLVIAAGLVTVYEIFYASPPEVVVSAPQPPAGSVASVAETVAEKKPEEVPAASVDSVEAVATGGAQDMPVTEPALPKEGSATSVPTPVGVSEVHFVFDAASWVEVRDRSERVLLSQLNAAGTEQRVSGRPPLSVVVGNARDVRMTVNGKPFDLVPHTRVEVARFTLE
jgi:cytoskeleton protein RodZ